MGMSPVSIWFILIMRKLAPYTSKNKLIYSIFMVIGDFIKMMLILANHSTCFNYSYSFTHLTTLLALWDTSPPDVSATTPAIKERFLASRWGQWAPSLDLIDILNVFSRIYIWYKVVYLCYNRDWSLLVGNYDNNTLVISCPARTSLVRSSTAILNNVVQTTKMYPKSFISEKSLDCSVWSSTQLTSLCQ